jgi:hypothetical protein
MAENVNPLILPIGADVRTFKESINNVKDALKSLQQDLAGKRFDLITDKERKLLEDYTRTLNTLQGDLSNTSKGFDKTTDSSKKTRTALTSLSLVAQDLPFGFIAIQNNLPNLISAFGQLDAKTNGIKGVLKELGSQLVGPAGLFLAFSAVTAAVTFAIKEYGSFGAAIKALLGTTSQLDAIQKRATDSLKEYNKEIVTNGEITGDASAKVSDQIFRLETLTGIVKDNTLSENQRANALKEIQKLDPERLKSLSLQKQGYQDLDEWVKIYTDSLIANAVAQEYLSKVVATTTQINQQTNLLAEISKGYVDIAKKRREAEGQQIFDPLTGADLTTTILGGLQTAEENLNKDFKEQKVIVDSLWKTLDRYKKSAADATKEAINFFRETKDGKGGKNEFTLGIDPQELDAAFNLDKIISSITKYGNALLDTNKSVEERKNALKELVAINPQVFSGLSLEKSATLANKDAIESYLRSLQVLIKEREFDARASQLNAQFLKAEEKAKDDAIKLDIEQADAIAQKTTAQDNYIKSLDKFLSKQGSYYAAIKEQQLINEAVIQDLTKGLKLDSVYNKAIENLLNFGEFAKKTTSDIVRSIKFLQEPFEGLFTTLLEEGSASWRTFADDVIKQIRRITASLLSRALINGIAYLLNLATGGAAGIVKAGLKGVSTDALGDFLSSTPGAANFSGIQGGPMQMAGAVNLTLRGSDLVASINRTNSTINRVG